MINHQLYVANSKIPKAGNGVFTNERIEAKKVVVFPNENHKILSKQEINDFPNQQAQSQSAIRWFDETYTIDPDWSLECNFNHSFNPNCLWYLGFIISLKTIEHGEELTIDYRHFLDEGYALDFPDSLTGEQIKGFSWREKMHKGAVILTELYSNEITA